MAKEKGKSKKTARVNAASKSSKAGKRSEKNTAGSTGEVPAPAPKRGKGQVSKSKNVANDKPAAQTPGAKQNGLFKFRRYKKAEGSAQKKEKHPKLIVEQEKQTVGFMGLTESPKRGHHKNIELEVNPQKGNTKQAYIRKEIRYSDLENFGEILEDYNLSKKDKQKVIEYIEKLKKKK